MLNLFKKLLGKSEAPAAPVPRVVARATPQAAPETFQAVPQVPQVEVAHLSLSAIIGKLPEDLKRTVAQMPDANITVALPLATIHKQLPTGSVKMSLASLYRQSPAGTFVQTRMEERRMVEVPLSEVFRHVNPRDLQKRDQRALEVPEDAVGLFGDTNNPFALTPGAPQAPAPQPRAIPAPQARAIQPPSEMRSAAPARPVSPAPTAKPAAPRAIAPPPAFANTPAAAAASDEPPLVLQIAQLAEQWPEPFRSEALALNGATVSLPAAFVTSGLAKGKVTFSWGQIRAWMSPAVESPTQGGEHTELTLPLKVVAPAFLAHSRPKSPRKTFEMDPTIPALFSGGTTAPEPPAVEEEPAPAPEPEPPAPAAVAEVPAVIAPPADLVPPAPVAPEVEPEPEPEVAPEPAAIEPSAPAIEPEPIAAPAIETPVEAPVAAAEPVLETPAAEPKQEAPAETLKEETEAPAAAVEPIAFVPAPGTKPKRTLGEILGDPEKTEWSPPELVRATVKLEGVAGAVVALQEGLLVAAELPEPMKGDTVAAFLPQIFARLSNYAGEMQLGPVEDVLFTSNGRLFQIYRLGEVYFAVLAKEGEKLPWESLRLIAAEAGGHHQK